MRKIREYDFNIWCPEDNVITLSAYKLKYVHNGMYHTDTTDWQTIRFNADHPVHRECVKYLLDFMGEGGEMYEDLDWWGGTIEEYKMFAPPTIAKWLDSLPEYEVEDDGDVIEQAKEVGKPYGEM